MAEGSMHDSDEEEGEEGEEGDEEDEGPVGNQGSPSKVARPISAPPQDIPTLTEIPSMGRTDTEMGGLEATARPPMLHLDRDKIEGKSGSPLKNVALTTSTLTSPLESPNTSSATPFNTAPVQELQPVSETAELASLNEEMQQEAVATAPPTLPSPPPQATVAEEIASTELLREEEEEEEMLLEIVENTNNASIGADEAINTAVPEAPQTAIPPIPEAEVISEPVSMEAPEVPAEQKDDPAPADPIPVETDAPQAVEDDDDDDFLDLLGGLEKQLNDPVSSGGAEAPPVVKSVSSPEKSAEDEQEKKEPEVAEEITNDVTDKA